MSRKLPKYLKLFKNPSALEGNWYRGNLHTHSKNSDGMLTPEEIVNRYRDRDYHFLSLTDHNIVTDTSRFLNRIS